MSVNIFWLYFIGSLLLINFTWVYFTAIMRLQQVRDAGKLAWRKNPVLWLLAWVNLIVGLVLDVAVNWLVCSVILLEFPREFLTTARLCRWYGSTSARPFDARWRKPVSAWFGETLLNDIDPSGKHVK